MSAGTIRRSGSSAKLSFRRVWKRIRKLSNRGLLRTIRDVVLTTGLILLISGYARGEDPDRIAAQFVTWLQAAIHDELAANWVRPVIADIFIPLMTYFGFFVALLTGAWLVRRIPAYVDFFVLSELHRRRGHNLSSIELLVGLSMPMALILALVCRSTLSIYACIHFALCYTYVRVSNDLSRTNTFLNWYGRGRPVVDSGMTSDSMDDDDDDDDTTTEDNVDEGDDDVI